MDDSKTKKINYFMSFALAVFVSYSCYSIIFQAKIRNKPNKQALSLIMKNSSLGDFRENFMAKYLKYGTEELIAIEPDEATLKIRMPGELGASDWMLYVQFDDEKITAMRMRKHDGIHSFHKPKETPADVGEEMRLFGGMDKKMP